MEIFELLKYDFFLNALISTLLIGISCGLVGTYIVAKRMVSSAAASPMPLSAA